MDIDVAKLEKVNPPCVNEYPIFYSKQGPVPSPLLTVDWKNPNASGYDPAEITVEISAVSGELLKVTAGDGSFSKRGQPLIKDLDKLLAIPDEEFLKYTPEERSNLVARFSAVDYSQTNAPIQNNGPPVDSPLNKRQTR